MNKEFEERIVPGMVRRALDQSTANLDSRVESKLYAFRQEALKRQAQPVFALSLAGMGRGFEHFVTGPMQGKLRVVLAALALVIGASGVQFWQNLQRASELAEIDSALLADEVSPSAYLDQGFMEWLTHRSQQEDEAESPGSPAP